MDFDTFLPLLKPQIRWWEDKGYHYCEGCGREMDRPEMENHWPFNCSLSRKTAKQKMRAYVIETNFELYQKYCEDKGAIVLTRIKIEEKSVPLSWYQKQMENFDKLNENLNIYGPSGAAVDEAPPIPLRTRTTEDLIPKICKKKIIKTGDPIIDALPMKDMPFRDLDGNILSYEELDELEEQERNEKEEEMGRKK